MGSPFYPAAHICLYCVNLTNPIDPAAIKDEVKALKQASPKARVILVGTKCDISDSFHMLNSLGVDLNIPSIMTSAKTGEGLDQLQNQLIDISKNTLTIRSEWQEAVAQLNNELVHLPPKKAQAMKEVLSTLTQQINLQPEERINAINEFMSTSHLILKDRYPAMIQAALTVAVVATMTLLAVAMAFTIGFMAGIWTGPGALLTGLVTSSAAVAIVASIAVASTGLLTYGIFTAKKSKEVTAVDDFSVTAKSIAAQ